MKSKWKAILAAAMAVCLLAGCAPAEPEEASAPRESSAAPTIFADAAADFERLQFETQDLEGNVCDSKELFALHDLTLVNIWATWCGPCIEEMPALETIYEEGEIGVVGIAVESEKQETAELAAEIAAELGVTYPNLRPTQEMIRDFLADAAYLPTTIFVDSEGKVVGGGLYIGGRTELEWRDTIESVQNSMES